MKRNAGAGRPNQHTIGKKKMVAVRLRPDLAQWLREQPESQSILIEQALIKAYGIKGTKHYET